MEKPQGFDLLVSIDTINVLGGRVSILWSGKVQFLCKEVPICVAHYVDDCDFHTE